MPMNNSLKKKSRNSHIHNSQKSQIYRNKFSQRSVHWKFQILLSQQVHKNGRIFVADELEESISLKCS